jgi:hypothetical protein
MKSKGLPAFLFYDWPTRSVLKLIVVVKFFLVDFNVAPIGGNTCRNQPEQD